MKSWLFRLPPLTSPTPLLAPVEQMSPASSRIPRLHTRGNTIWVHASAVHVRVSVWAVWYVRTNLSCVFLNVTVLVWFVCMNASSYICVCVCVCVFLLVIEGVRGSIWCCGQTVRRTCVRVCFQFFFFFRSSLVCLCMCVCVFACLHTPHLDRNSQMSFACGRWDPLENRIHTIPKSHILYPLHPCSPIPQSLLVALVCEPCFVLATVKIYSQTHTKLKKKKTVDNYKSFWLPNFTLGFCKLIG